MTGIASIVKKTVKDLVTSKRLAFILAEVLITLGIIGVVAEITIPSLIQKYNDNVTVLKVKKYNSILAQSELLWEQVLGCVGNISSCLSSFNAYDSHAFKVIEKNLSIIDEVYKYEDTSKIAWLPDKTIKMDGSGTHTHARG